MDGNKKPHSVLNYAARRLVVLLNEFPVCEMVENCPVEKTDAQYLDRIAGIEIYLIEYFNAHDIQTYKITPI